MAGAAARRGDPHVPTLWLRRGTAALMVFLALGGGALASDQPVNTTDPGATDGPDGSNPLDTKYTPLAKEGASAGWQQVAGAIHPDSLSRPLVKNGYNPDATPVTVDFYTIAFADRFHGVAAG